MNSNKQTAVEFIIESVMDRGIYTKEMLKEFEQAKEMEKQKTIDFIKWIGGAFSFGNIHGKWYSHEDTDKEYTEEELYQIYLKEN